MVNEAAAPSLGWLWLIPASPFVAFAVIGLLTRPWRRLSAAVSVFAMSLSFMFALGAFFFQLRQGPAVQSVIRVAWFTTGTLSASVGLLLDPLSAVMLVVITTVGLLVQVYSLGYMAGEKGMSRYFAYMSLFCASMLGLVLSNNLLQLYICWELVGLCSYLLIGFWYDRVGPAFAAKKAFVTTRLGDLGFLVGVIMLVFLSNSFDFEAVRARTADLMREPGGTRIIGLAALLLFCGAVGKSAQVPLHVWLPDAMEGPTPVSALIHAATMVCAGVFMVARLFFLFAAAPDAMAMVAQIGALTAFFGATVALVQTDLKRVLAYSTISQLGYMMLALGVGALTAGMFHLWTHAFFKALLFLAAGAVLHSARSNDMREMGGLGKAMPWTAGAFAVGGLALAGIFPFSGFFSKDMILMAVREKSGFLFLVALATAGMTGFYVARAFFMTFMGPPRTKGLVHEAPWVMRGPILVLAVLSLGAGWWSGGFSGFVFSGIAPETAVHFLPAAGMMLPPLLGIGLAWSMYVAGVPGPAKMAGSFSGLHTLLKRRYYIDEFYDWVVDSVVMKLSSGLAWFDRNAVDGAVNGIGFLARRTGDGLRRLQTGQVQHYAAAVFGGAVLLVILARLMGAY
jgi:NADH-quinone oxidoreductase subunit L